MPLIWKPAQGFESRRAAAVATYEGQKCFIRKHERKNYRWVSSKRYHAWMGGVYLGHSPTLEAAKAIVALTVAEALRNQNTEEAL
jgi:hypothetical protein